MRWSSLCHSQNVKFTQPVNCASSQVLPLNLCMHWRDFICLQRLWRTARLLSVKALSVWRWNEVSARRPRWAARSIVPQWKSWRRPSICPTWQPPKWASDSTSPWCAYMTPRSEQSFSWFCFQRGIYNGDERFMFFSPLFIGRVLQVAVHHKFKNSGTFYHGAEEKRRQPRHQCCCEWIVYSLRCNKICCNE